MALAAYGLHSFSINRLEAKHKTEMAAQQLALTKKCEADKAITTRVSHDLQIQLASLDSRLDASHRMLNGKCTGVLTFTAPRYDAPPATKEPLGRNVGGTEPKRAATYASAGHLISIAGKGERYRLQLLACQKFVSAVANEEKTHH